MAPESDACERLLDRVELGIRAWRSLDRDRRRRALVESERCAAWEELPGDDAEQQHRDRPEDARARLAGPPAGELELGPGPDIGDGLPERGFRPFGTDPHRRSRVEVAPRTVDVGERPGV